MNLLFLLIGFTISPADSARALISVRCIPEAAVYYAQMAAADNGAWMLELGRILEASGRFAEAHRAYGIALGNSTEREISNWLINRRTGVSAIDTTVVITVSIANSGVLTARNIEVIVPMPVSHPPLQSLTILNTDFHRSARTLTADIPFILPGDTVELCIELGIIQQPGTERPITEAISDETLAWLTQTLRSMAVPETLPGPCIPMSEELARLGGERGIEIRVEGGLLLDRNGCIFHAWSILEDYGLRVDPLLFKEDSLLSIAHNPTDVIPLWDLEPTQGFELSLVFSNPRYDLTGAMTAETR
jgi:hypothetical protein